MLPFPPIRPQTEFYYSNFLTPAAEILASYLAVISSSVDHRMDNNILILQNLRLRKKGSML